MKRFILAALLASFSGSAFAAAAYQAPNSPDLIPKTVDTPFSDFAVLTADDTVSHNVVAGRIVEVNCAGAGNISLKLFNGKSKVLPVVIGEQTLPWAAVGYNVTNTTATGCTVTNWY